MKEQTQGMVAEAGTRVQIKFQVLGPGERAANLPPDTARVPYEVRVKGILVVPGRLGDEVTVVTMSDRRMTGTLLTIEPADTHTFGRPPRALVEAQEAIRALLQGGSDD